MKVLLIGSSGYIGSLLAHELQANTQLEIITCDVRALEGVNAPDHLCQYQMLSEADLAAVDIVLFFAGCSSVGAAVADPAGAIQQNALDLLQLRFRMRPQTYLIYASSGSVYSQAASATPTGEPRAATESSDLALPQNAYDASKAAADWLMDSAPGESLGLRLGTVCGWSPSLRSELVFNSMILSAIGTGEIKVGNGSAWRALLHLADLSLCIQALLMRPDRLNGVLNVASENIRIGRLAERLAVLFGARMVTLPDSPTYNFSLDLQRSRELFQCDSRTLEEHAVEFAERAYSD
jgi:nucleoside-diphosphate-sugar epimerase